MKRPLNTNLAILLALSLGGALPAHADTGPSVWLGVQLAPVPRSLDTHLQLDGKGVMVRNVYVGSPADRAGIDRYDVITQVDGEAVTESVEGFSHYIRQRRPGDEINLTLIQQGQPVTLRVPLEPREKDWGEFQPKYRDDPELSHSREYDFRGHILKPGPKGWTWHDLGEMPEVFDFLIDPERGDVDRRRWLEVPEHFEARHVDEDGNIIHVERKQNGTIVVTRLKEGQHTDQAEVKEYLSLEELEVEDPEAAKLVEKVKPRKPRPNVEVYRDPRMNLPELEEWRREFRRLVPRPEDLDREEPREFEFQLRLPPRTLFDVKPDGTIEVQVQGDDSELRQTFESEDELRAKAPKLYEKYQRLYGQLR